MQNVADEKMMKVDLPGVFPEDGSAPGGIRRI